MSGFPENRSPNQLDHKAQNHEVQAFSDRKYNKWSEEENEYYCTFLEQNLQEFRSDRGRRTKNFFIRMSQFLNEERDNEQCRSHHQKMLKKYGTVQKIIASLKKSDQASVSSKDDEITVRNTSIVDIPVLEHEYQEESNHTISMFLENPEYVILNDPFSDLFGGPYDD